MTKRVVKTVRVHYYTDVVVEMDADENPEESRGTISEVAAEQVRDGDLEEREQETLATEDLGEVDMGD